MNYSFPSSWCHWRKNRRCTKSLRNIFYSENCNLGGCPRVLQLNAQRNLLGQNLLYCSDTMMRTKDYFNDSTESLWLMWRGLTVGIIWLYCHAAIKPDCSNYNPTTIRLFQTTITLDYKNAPLVMTGVSEVELFWEVNETLLYLVKESFQEFMFCFF